MGGFHAVNVCACQCVIVRFCGSLCLHAMFNSQCIQMHLSPTETIHYLWTQGSIEPELTQLVWSMLEEQNPAFFEVQASLAIILSFVSSFSSVLSPLCAVILWMQVRSYVYSLVQVCANNNVAPLFEIHENPVVCVCVCVYVYVYVCVCVCVCMCV